jgi:polyisoprenoid-binding protein YceI
VDLDRYTIDPGMSRFTVRAFASGMFSSFGHNPTIAIRDLSGEVDFAPDSPEKSALRLKIDSKSLAVTDDIGDKDRREMERMMNQEVLETSRFPEITFETASVTASGSDGRYAVNMTGNLSLHGVTRGQQVAAQVSLSGDTLNAHGEFPLSQTSYGIKLVSVAGGALKLKDELKFNFDIVARKAESR